MNELSSVISSPTASNRQLSVVYNSNASHNYSRVPLLFRTIGRLLSILVTHKSSSVVSKTTMVMRKSHYLTLVEPVMATAMMAAFSIAYKRVKTHLMNRLKHLEQDLILENRVAAITNACIRQNSVIPSNSIDQVMRELKTFIKVDCHPLDPYVKQLTVTWYHPRTGARNVNRVLLPVHSDLKLLDNASVFSVDSHMISPQQQQFPMKALSS